MTHTKLKQPDLKVLCLHCDSQCRLTTGAEVHSSYDTTKYLHFWKCDVCINVWCGCHNTGVRPFGRPADRPTRQARRALHMDLFDPIWQSAPKARRNIVRATLYDMLAVKLKLGDVDAHIGNFSFEQCAEAREVLTKYAKKKGFSV
jgi:zinc-finger-containing domain